MSFLCYSMLTIGLFWSIKRTLGALVHPLCNPLLWCVVILIALLHFTPLSFIDYQQANQWLIWLLEPAVVALAIPLFNQLQQLKKQLWPIIICCFIGSILAMGSGVAIALALTGDKQLLLSILPKSVTSPIAMDISNQIGGITPLVAGIVIIVGLIGAMIGSTLFKLLHINDPQAQGLAMGNGAHALGTATALNMGEVQGAFSSIALVLCGIFTAVLAPIFTWFINIS